MQRPPFRSLMLPTHNMWLLMRATCTRSGQCAMGRASGGKKTLPQMALGGRGAIPDHTLSPTSCSHVSSWTGSTFALQELQVSRLVVQLLARRFFLQVFLLNYALCAENRRQTHCIAQAVCCSPCLGTWLC